VRAAARDPRQHRTKFGEALRDGQRSAGPQPWQAKRSAAKRQLKRFLTQLGSVAKDISTELLGKYLESKGL
jgi:hypothetical protein